MDHAEFDLLVDRHLDGGLDPDGQDRLESLLKTDASLRARFWELARIHGQIAWVAQERHADLPANEAVVADRALRDSSTKIPQATSAQAQHRRPRSHLRTTPSIWRRLLPMALAAGIAVAAGLTWLTGGPLPTMPVTDDAVIADLANVRWQSGTGPAVGEAVGNRQLLLESGLAQVRFASGATVILQGPASFVARSARGGHLDHGRLTARVPDSAKGFTVEADGVRVIDLGTEFGLAVGAKARREGEIAVFDGMVQVTPTTAQVLFPQVLHHGEATRVDASGQLKTISYDDSAFVRAMPAELASPLLDRGLMAWWRMDETSGSVLRDSSGRGHDAQVRGAIIEQLSVTGHHGRAVRFVDRSFAEIANHPDFTLMEMTLFAWVRPEANQRIDAQIICKQGSYGLAMPRNEAMKFYFWHMDRVVDHPFKQDHWVNLCATFDGAIRRFYVDGVRIATINSPTAPKTDEPVRLGTIEDGKNRDRLFQGAIDEIRIYNRALSENEVRLLFLGPSRTTTVTDATQDQAQPISYRPTGSTL